MSIKQQEEKASYQISKDISPHDGVAVFSTTGTPIQYEEKSTRPMVTVTNFNKKQPGVFLLRNCLTSAECKEFIQVTERMGYTEAKITVGKGQFLSAPEIRNNKRLIWETPLPEVDVSSFAAVMWNRIKSHIPSEVTVRGHVWESCGMNERLRFYRYTGGEQFREHYDGCFPRSSQEMSLLTFIIYLSDGFEGGATTFYSEDDRSSCWREGRAVALKVTPVEGAALLFWHGQHPDSPLHEGSMVIKGTKYVLRSDVMYRRRQTSQT